MLKSWILLARKQRASDLHLEPGLPLAIRVRGQLKTIGDPVAGKALLDATRSIVPEKLWATFLERRSYDLVRVIAGVYCRINVLTTARGVGLAVRLLSGFEPTLTKLNLHPDLAELVRTDHGLVVVCGATGSGKSSTLAALIHEVNVGRPRHVITIENPIEYHFQPRKALIRQREVGRDTPSVEQALLDALREDPDVLMVGEMRHRETMQLTLDAAETGHLVLATMHSSTASEALQRIAAAFPAEIQMGVRAQLADCFIGVLNQRLIYRADAGVRIPECELLRATPAVRSHIREGQFFKLASAMETGAADGMWTFERYRRWLDERRHWYVPRADEVEAPAPVLERSSDLPPLRSAAATPQVGNGRRPPAGATESEEPHVIEEEDATTIDEIIAELEGS